MVRQHPSALRKLQQLWRLVRESHANPIAGSPRVPELCQPDELGVTFIGHSSFLIQIGGKNVLIDPVFSRYLILLRRQRHPGVRIQDLPPIDAVLITHAHMDHLNLPSLRKVIRHTRRITGVAPEAIVPKHVGDLVAKLGFRKITELEWWQSAELGSPSEERTVSGLTEECHPERNEAQRSAVEGPAVAASEARHLREAQSNSRTHSPSLNMPDPQSRSSAYRFEGDGLQPVHSHSQETGALAPEGATVRVTMTPCKHWGARMFNDMHRHYGGYVLSNGTHSVYHSGDTAYFQGFREIGRLLKPQIALLPIGAYYPDSYRAVHTSPEEALQAFQDLGTAHTMIPMHYGTFNLGKEPMGEPLPRLRSAAAKSGNQSSIEVQAEGETLRVDAKATEKRGALTLA